MWFLALAALASALEPRVPLRVPPPALPAPLDGAAVDVRLTVKFRDEARARPTADGGVGLQADRAALDRVIRAHGLRFSALIQVDEAALTALQARAEARSGSVAADLAGMMVVEVGSGDLVAAGDALRALELVEYVYVEALGVPPPGDIAPTTADHSGEQGWLGPDPGIDVEYAWSLGVTGVGIDVADVEYGWNAAHEDLVDRALHLESGQTIPSWVGSYGYDEHGTAALGEIAAVENAYGVTGGMHGATTYTFPEWSDEQGSRRATAITSAAARSAPGSVVMLEMQDYGPDGRYAPAEVNPNVFTAVQTATAAGVVVVGAAGNGSANLDGAAYASGWGSWGDSGAILVGAGSADTNHAPLYFTTYGSRVNLQGWGEAVFTLGYGYSYAYGGDPNQYYYSGFNGTSSATPVVTTAVIAVQGLLVAQGAPPLSPLVARQLLVDTGIPQGGGVSIGPLPDLAAALGALDADGDGWVGPDYGGTDCDDADPGRSPSAEETWYDGVDSDCDGADDYDQDGDGHPVDVDCDDLDPGAWPGAEDAWYDGVDSDCGGEDDYDQDGDGSAVDLDCDDLDPANTPGQPEVEDGRDNDCDGHDELWDGDGDGLTELDEQAAGTDPDRADTDEDGLDDGEELDRGTDPLVADSDGDGIPDGREVRNGTDPLDADDPGEEGIGCGCATGGGGGYPAGLLALAALARRRPRGGSPPG